MLTCQRFADSTAHDCARRALAEALGTDSPITWDEDHHLQGHVDHDGAHLVVIAPRDDAHRALVLSEADWDAVRRGIDTAA